MGRPPACNCRCLATPIYTQWGRLMEIVGPLADGEIVAGYNEAWTFTSQNLPVNTWAWQARVDVSLTPDVGPSPSNGYSYHWHKLMQPIRYRIGYNDQNPLVNDAKASIRVAEQPNETAALSDYSVPAAGHVAPARVTQCTAHVPLLLSTQSGTTNLQATGSTLRYARLMINGVDRTGVVPLNRSFVSVDCQPIGTFAELSLLAFGLPLTSATLTDDDEIFIDLWVEARLRGMVYPPFPGFPTVFPAVIAWPRSHVHRVDRQMPWWITRIDGANTAAKVRSSYRWRIVLPGGSPYTFPDGNTSLILDSGQPGWTTTKTASAVQMIHTVSQEVVQFDWSREVPEIQIRTPATYASGSLRWFRWQPDGTDYSAYPYGQYGVWTPNAAKQFNVQGTLTTGSISGMPWWLSYGRSPAVAAQMFSDVPENLTVERI